MRTNATNRAIVWGLLALALVGNIAGYAFDLYQRFGWFDKAIHTYTLFALTLLLALLLYGRALTGLVEHKILLILVIGGLGLALGTIWEFAEWGYDQVIPSDVIKGKRDTITDLIVDAVGALIAGWLATLMLEPSAEDDDS